MINVSTEGEYDAEKNILTVRFINKWRTIEDAEFIASEVERWVKLGGENKVWAINDITHSGMAPPKLISHYEKKASPLIEKYVADFCVICDKPFERIAAQFFMVLTKDKHPIVKTMDEAIDCVLKEQEKRGRFIPLE